MKAIVFLLFIGLLAVQADVNSPVSPSSFRLPVQNIKVADDDELWGWHDFIEDMNNVGHFVENVANQAYANTRNMIIEKYEILEEKIFNTIDNYGGFYNSVHAWENVDMRNGASIMRAIQITAVDSKNVYVKINKLSGDRLNMAAINYAEGVALEVFPPAAIAIEAGKIVYRSYGQYRDITELVHNIQYDVQNRKWGALSIDSFKLFRIIYKIL